jgi:pimeloyl-ACP methyl ester carboxylesterase
MAVATKCMCKPVLFGKNDKVTPPDVAEEFNKLLPNLPYILIDKCGHAAMMDILKNSFV